MEVSLRESGPALGDVSNWLNCAECAFIPWSVGCQQCSADAVGAPGPTNATPTATFAQTGMWVAGGIVAVLLLIVFVKK